MSDYLWDPSQPVDPEVARLEELLAPLRAPTPALPPLPPRVRQPSLAPPTLTSLPWVRGALALAAGLLLALWMAPREAGRPLPAVEGWRVVATRGTPRFGELGELGERPLRGEGRLGVGEWLTTGPGDTAELQVADIGRLRIAPSSRVRLTATAPHEHRLLLERGGLSAQVSAPPRLFLVDTPRGRASDLGCAYELRVDEEGAATLIVEEGAVELSNEGAAVYVPAGARCRADAAGAPGTPVWSHSSLEFLAAVDRLDEALWESGAASDELVGEVLQASSAEDSLSLWFLLPRVEGGARRRVIDGLTRMVPLPPGVTFEAVFDLDPAALADWRRTTPWSGGSKRRK
jgi:hypothetical protein